MEAVSLRLSSRQIALLRSSLWAQSISPANMPENCEAIAHMYSLVDPFLHLVQDGKLQAVNPGSVCASKAYGSKEDDECALKVLSQIKIDEEHTRESFATIIVKSSENLLESDSSILREQLVLEFVPEDVCPLGAQMLVDATRLDFKSNESPEEAAVISATDDDAFLDLYDSQTKHDLQLSVQNPNLLGINQLLESAFIVWLDTCKSWRQRMDVSYKEMTGHCEALLMGKQQKISKLMSTEPKPGSLMNFSSQNQDDHEAKKMISHGYDIRNPFSDQNFGAHLHKPHIDLHHPHLCKLPASNPFDTFLKAAGC